MPPNTPRSKTSGRYANATIQILIGDDGEPFHVHYAVLEQTAFFKEHPHPAILQIPEPSPSRSSNIQNSPAPSEGTVGPDDTRIKTEDGIMENNDAVPTMTPAPIKMPVYRLKGAIYEPAAFEVIVHYLYNQRPSTPVHRQGLCVFRKAYILALRFEMEGLQDDILNCFRDFNNGYKVLSEDLLWFVKRIGGEEASVCYVPIIQYLVAQCAYEIHKEGYEYFASQNINFESFLIQGDHPVRKILFQAISKLAHETNPTDPAKGVNFWTAANWRQETPDTQESEPDTDIIEID